MSDDLEKLEKEILALSSGQRAELLRGLVEKLESSPDSTALQDRVAEAQHWYRIFPETELKHDSSGETMHKENDVLHGSASESDKTKDQLDRITRHPALMGGKACIRGMRVTVAMIVGQIGTGTNIEDLLADYPYLEREDILQALRYAARCAEEREIMLT